MTPYFGQTAHLPWLFDLNYIDCVVCVDYERKLNWNLISINENKLKKPANNIVFRNTLTIAMASTMVITILNQIILLELIFFFKKIPIYFVIILYYYIVNFIIKLFLTTFERASKTTLSNHQWTVICREFGTIRWKYVISTKRYIFNVKQYRYKQYCLYCTLIAVRLSHSVI